MNFSKISPAPQSEVLHGGKITLGTVGVSDCRLILKNNKKAPLAIEAYELLKSKLRSTLFLNKDESFSSKVSITLEISKNYEARRKKKTQPPRSYGYSRRDF